jgi:hypothetical protein
VGTCKKIARPHFAEKFLKLFRSDLERTRKDTTLNPKTIQLMNKKFLIITFVLSSLAFLTDVKAQTNTFYGQGAGTNTSGDYNSGFGYYVLASTNSGHENTAIGDSALEFNTTGSWNTASGAFALYSNTTGFWNTANGYQALFGNTTGTYNTASGNRALASNTNGTFNTASGTWALEDNTTGSSNAASGTVALADNTTGSNNTASGTAALRSNTTGSYNMANGYQALYSTTTGGFNAADGAFVLYSNTIGNFNTATGPGALFSNTTGSNNVAIGTTAGIALTTGSGNVCIGAGVNGVAGESNTTRIRNVYTMVANGRAVYVNADNKIGTLSSSRRFKHDIQPMDRSSETLFALKPVTFRYKKDADPSQALSFGLIAEDVAEVSPELITRDEEGKPQTVRYEAVNAMLLNEFLKAHNAFVEEQRKVEKLEATVANLVVTVKAQATKIQKVSGQLQLQKQSRQNIVSSSQGRGD